MAGKRERKERIQFERADTVTFSVTRKGGDYNETLWYGRRDAHESASFISTGDGRFIMVRDKHVDLFVQFAKALRAHVRTQVKVKKSHA